MKKIVSALTLMTIPSIALAHPGHGGIGLLHHLYDLLPFVAVVILAGGLYMWKRKH